MTAEMQKLANDPNFVVQFAVGDPAPELISQERTAGINFDGVFFPETKRYIVKKAHLSRDDVRIFDVATGKLVFNSHHPGKNPYECTDPLGLTNQDDRYKVAGGEWNSICDVTAHGYGFRSFKIRPKHMSMHGRQYVKRQNDEIAFNVGKIGKLSSMSLRDNFEVCSGDGGDVAYKITADMMGRTFSIFNEKEELVAQMAKTKKALMQTAVFGSGSESTVDIAAGVDCSTILASIFAMMQVGESVVGDFLGNFVVDPAKSAAVDNAVDATGMGDVVGAYESLSNQASSATSAFSGTARFLRDNFFK